MKSFEAYEALRRYGRPLLACALFVILLPQCSPPGEQKTSAGAPALDTPEQKRAREELVRTEIEPHVDDERVLAAMRDVPRHVFVPKSLSSSSYDNRPLPIDKGQTISQPVVVAEMTARLDLESDDRVLEIGTGSGYQCAILAELVSEVYSIEIVPELAETARERLESLGYDNVRFRVGDGFHGWKEAAPFDAIIVTAAPEEVPPPLLEQLRAGGRLIIPVGDRWQELVLIRRNSEAPGDFTRESIFPVRFVPMTGQARTGPQPSKEEDEE